jgi:adenosylcobinamide kinase/adenosylcobinamide-phosphate guanylyltransferase
VAASGHILVLGGQRSGKSRYAENLVASSLRLPVYLATATAGDPEMHERIEAHRARRGREWRTVEEPLDISGQLLALADPGRAVLVECLTLWLANLLEARREPAEETDRLVEALRRADGPAVIVSNEVGAGIVPENALARRYADALGVLNQRIAAAVGRVVLVAAGIPVLLKPANRPEVTL